MVGEISTISGGLMGQADQNPIAVVQAKFKEAETRFEGWVAKQSFPVEAAVFTGIGVAQGAAIGAFLWTLFGECASLVVTRPLTFKRDSMALLNRPEALSGGPLVQIRNYAVLDGVDACVTHVMSQVRGKEDVQTRMTAAFSSGAMFTLVSGMGVQNAVAVGLSFALIQGGAFQLLCSKSSQQPQSGQKLSQQPQSGQKLSQQPQSGQKLSQQPQSRQKLSQQPQSGQKLSQQPQSGQKLSRQPQAEDLNYVKTRFMLRDLGLENYEKKFKRGLLFDSTLPLLNDSALKDLKIPLGPRLLILDYIERYSSFFI
ncbi:hypothetical protein OROMI_010845 [Orobanche minor]